MRRSVRDQLPLVPASFGHHHVHELAAMRALLDAIRNLRDGSRPICSPVVSTLIAGVVA